MPTVYLQAFIEINLKCRGAVHYREHFLGVAGNIVIPWNTSLTPALLPCSPSSLLSLSFCLYVNTVECALRAWKASSVALLAFIWSISSLNALSKCESTVAPPVCERSETGRGGGTPQGHRQGQTDVDVPRRDIMIVLNLNHYHFYDAGSFYVNLL